MRFLFKTSNHRFGLWCRLGIFFIFFSFQRLTPIQTKVETHHINVNHSIRYLISFAEFLYITSAHNLTIFNKNSGHQSLHKLNICESRILSINIEGEVMPAGEDCFLAPPKTILNHYTRIQKKISYSGLALASGLDLKGKNMMILDEAGNLNHYQRINNDYIKISQAKLPGFDSRYFIPVGFDSTLKYLAVRNWKEYYVYIYDVFTNKLMHKSEYYLPAVNRKGNIFSFSEDSRYYFDGKRVREIQTGKLVFLIDSRNCYILKQSSFSKKGSYLGILNKYDNNCGAKIIGESSTVEIYQLENNNKKNLTPVHVIHKKEKINAIGFDSIEKNIIYIGFENGNVNKIKF